MTNRIKSILNTTSMLMQESKEHILSDITMEDLMKVISKKSFINNTKRIFRVANPKMFNGYKFDSVKYYYARTWNDKPTEKPLHAIVRFEKEGQPLFIYCSTSDGVTWYKLSVQTKLEYGGNVPNSDTEFLKEFS